MYNRLRYLRKDILKLRQADFAKALGMTIQAYSLIETQKRPLLDRHIKVICAKWSVSERWLKDGVEPIFWESIQEVYLQEICKQLSPGNIELLVNIARNILEKQDMSDET